MRKIWLVPFILIVISGLSWWALGRGGGPQAHTVNLSIIAQTLYGPGPGGVIRVKEGDGLTLRISVDEPMLVHLHGYDLEARVKPGENATIQFTANVPGRHALMIHGLGEGEGERRVEILLGMVDVRPGR